MNITNSKTANVKKMDNSVKTNIRYLTNEETQTPLMHILEFEAGGFTFMHTHQEEHRYFVLEGEGVVFDGRGIKHFHTGDFVHIEANEIHLIKNNTKNPLHFLST